MNQGNPTFARLLSAALPMPTIYEALGTSIGRNNEICMMFQMGLQQQKQCHLRGFDNTLILVNRVRVCGYEGKLSKAQRGK